MKKINPRVIAVTLTILSVLLASGLAISNVQAPGGIFPGEGTGADGGG